MASKNNEHEIIFSYLDGWNLNWIPQNYTTQEQFINNQTLFNTWNGVFSSSEQSYTTLSQRYFNDYYGKLYFIDRFKSAPKILNDPCDDYRDNRTGKNGPDTYVDEETGETFFKRGVNISYVSKKIFFNNPKEYKSSQSGIVIPLNIYKSKPLITIKLRVLEVDATSNFCNIDIHLYVIGSDYSVGHVLDSSRTTNKTLGDNYIEMDMSYYVADPSDIVYLLEIVGYNGSWVIDGIEYLKK